MRATACARTCENSHLDLIVLTPQTGIVDVIADGRFTARAWRRRTATLDRAFLDELELTQVLRDTFGATAVSFEVLEVDLVRETTLVDVRYRVAKPVTRRSARAVGSTAAASSPRSPAPAPFATASPSREHVSA